jgi:hypothetical protein
MTDSTVTQYELRFQSLSGSGRGYAFPCDPHGRVELDQLSERARINYLYARAVVGRELAAPAVMPGEALIPAISGIDGSAENRTRVDSDRALAHLRSA